MAHFHLLNRYSYIICWRGANLLFGPNVEHKWEWVTPGAIFAVVAFLGISFLLSLYLRSAPSFNNLIYGSLGVILVLMLRLYLMGLIILIGPEIHNEIENAPGDRLLKRRS